MIDLRVNCVCTFLRRYLERRPPVELEPRGGPHALATKSGSEKVVPSLERTTQPRRWVKATRFDAVDEGRHNGSIRQDDGHFAKPVQVIGRSVTGASYDGSY